MSLWDDLLVAEDTLDRLRRDATASRPAHAWLFTGAGFLNRQIGLVFAATLLCERLDSAERGCGSCKGCVTVMNGSHADFTHFRTETVNISIEQARELVVKAQERPATGRWRVILVEDTERMGERTSNVLLKAIEEPPPHTIWLLCAPSPADVLVTIRSRCRIVQLPVPTTKAITTMLAGRGVDADRASHIAALAAGDAQLAWRLASDAKALARREDMSRLVLTVRSLPSAMGAAEKLMNLAEQDAEQVSAARNETERAELMQLLGLSASQRISPTLRAQLRRLEEQQKRRARRVQTDTLARAVSDIMLVLRDVLTIQLDARVPLVNEHLREQLHEYAAITTAANTLDTVRAAEATLHRLGTNANARLALEALMSRFVPARR